MSIILIFQLVLFFLSLAFRFVIFVIRLAYNILIRPIVINPLITIIYVWYYLNQMQGMDWLYALLIAAAAAALVVLVILKIRYIGLAVLSGFAAVWGYGIYTMFTGIIKIPNHPYISIIFCLVLGMGYFFGHILAGLKEIDFCGGAINIFVPFKTLYYKITGKDEPYDLKPLIDEEWQQLQPYLHKNDTLDCEYY